MTAANTPSPPAQQSKNVFRLHGVNVLNRKNVDSIARLTALERRRATHILDERQRRDTMNQLLTELASLVQESSTQATTATTTTPPPPPALPIVPAPTMATLNADGKDKKPARPPVKSNSITTLRNAIAEIRRLRACAGLQAISSSHSSSSSSGNHLVSSSSSSSSSTRPPRSPSRSQRSCSRSASPVSFPEQHASSSTSSTSSSSSSSLSTLAALAARQRDGLLDDLGGGGSQNSGESCSSPSPMSSPKLQQASSSSYSLCALSAAQEGSSSLIRDPTRNQLHSPPLSPSSPLTTSPYHFLGVTGGGPFPPMGSLDLSPHHGLQQQQQQQQQQQPYLPQLASVVSPMSTMTFLSPQETEEEEYQSVSQAEYRPGALWGVDHSSSSP